MYHVKFSFSFQNCIQIFCITFPLLFIFISNHVLLVMIFFISHFTMYISLFVSFLCIILKNWSVFSFHTFLLLLLSFQFSFFHFRFISFFSVLFIVVFFLFLFLLFLLSRPRARPTCGQRPSARVGRSGRWWRRRKAPPWIQTAGWGMTKVRNE